jgi:DNA polymerase elongation subunit (family B)
MPFLLLQCRTTSSYYKFREALNRLFPAPTKEDVQSGKWKEMNKVILCDAYSKEEMKFCDWIDIGLCGWVRLPKGMYKIKNDISYAQHTFYGGHVEAVYDKENIAPVLIDSFDIETIRADGANAMPNPINLDDCVATIAHAIRPSDRSQETYYIAWAWGGKVTLPTHDRKTKEPLPQRNIILKVYENEAQMLISWVRWRRSMQVSPDVTIGWNIYGFDLGYIATRIRVLQASYNIPEDVKEWGRLVGYETKIKESKIQSKAIAYNQYKLTPSPGNVFIDSLIFYQRDVTLRLPDYHLQTVAKHFLKEGKTDVHYSEIKKLFFGTPEERGYLIWYNVQDCDLVLRLFFHSGHWPKSVNVCRVNRVLLNLLCPRGQQIRVFGGFHYVAHKNGYVVYRPHYHPILDAPIVEEENEAEVDYLAKRFEKKSDNQALVEYYMKIMSRAKLKPQVTRVTKDESGNEIRTVVESGEMENTGKRTHGQLFSVGESVKIYKPDEKKKKTASDKPKQKVFRFANGKTSSQASQEFDKGRRRNPNKKLVKGEDGKYHEILLNKKVNDDSVEKGFSGGFVMEPRKGFFRNVPILDFNALYPNIMMSYCLDPALLVLDEDFANCPGVEYLEIRFSEDCVFRFAQGQPGVMIQHTRNLVNNRKIAQGVMNSYNDRMEYSAAALKQLLGTDKEKFEDIVPVAENLLKKGLKAGNDAKSKAILLHAYELLLDGEKEVLFDLFKNFLEFNDKDDAKDDVKELCKWMKERLLHTGIEDVVETCTSYLQTTKDPIHKDVVKFILSTIQGYIQKIVDLTTELQGLGWDFTQVIDLSTLSLEEKALAIFLVLDLCVTYKSDHVNYNSKQNELKVGSNSTFGFLGAGGQFAFTKDGHIQRRGMMPVSPVSACVTYIGRK